MLAYTFIRDIEKELKTMTRITVSFKQTTRDMRLFTTVNAMEEKSDFIKDAIEFYLEYLNKKDKED